MPSPFPGMDPFIEGCGLFEDFHTNLIGAIYRAVAPRLPANYAARTGTRSYLVLTRGGEEVERPMLPDVTVVVTRRKKGRAKAPAGAATRPQPNGSPVTMRALVEAEFRESFVEIREVAPQRRLVTCVEVLSPSNKRRGTEGWDLYLRKRQSFFEGSANFVEIDLLRHGERMPMRDDWPDVPYYLLVCRKQEAPFCKVWPAYSVAPLPKLPIPLARPDPDLELDVQPLVDEVYALSRYEQDIDYRHPPDGLLSAEDAAWLKARLRPRRG
jgi:hypothetical protein